MLVQRRGVETGSLQVQPSRSGKDHKDPLDIKTRRGSEEERGEETILDGTEGFPMTFTETNTGLSVYTTSHLLEG